jgi:hypothetical protein
MTPPTPAEATAEAPAPQHRAAAARLLGSYLLRVLERRAVRVSLAYELHDLGSGTKLLFTTPAELEQHLARAPGPDTTRRTP